MKRPNPRIRQGLQTDVERHAKFTGKRLTTKDREWAKPDAPGIHLAKSRGFEEATDLAWRMPLWLEFGWHGIKPNAAENKFHDVAERPR